MAYIPTGAKWYVAELLEHIKVEGDARNVLHNNLVLIRADSPEEAYQKALLLGRGYEDSYLNPTGKRVLVTFRGLSGLNVVHDELEHGAELLYEEHIGISDEAIQDMIVPKDQLAIFPAIEARKSPDYAVGEVVKDVERLLNNGQIP